MKTREGKGIHDSQKDANRLCSNLKAQMKVDSFLLKCGLVK